MIQQIVEKRILVVHISRCERTILTTQRVCEGCVDTPVLVLLECYQNVKVGVGGFKVSDFRPTVLYTNDQIILSGSENALQKTFLSTLDKIMNSYNLSILVEKTKLLLKNN